MSGGWSQLLDEALAALENGRHHDALQLCDRAAMLGEEARYHAAMLRGDIIFDLGDPAGALSCYESVADPDHKDPDLDAARGTALFELGRLAEAENALRSATRDDPENADAWFVLGLVAELKATGEEVELFRRARKLAPDRYPPLRSIPQEAFERALEQAIASLDPGMQKAIEEIPVLIADLPHPEDLRLADPPLSPRALGIFVGTPPTLAGSVMEIQEAQQPAMVLFKRNIERAVGSGLDAVTEISETIKGELSLALGLAENIEE